MTIPHLDALHPLCASPLSKEKVASSEANPTPLVLALVRQALQLVRSSEAWKRGKEYGSSAPRKGGKVLSLYCPSDMSGRLSKCAWHARLSRHNARDCGLDFADFYDGLGTDQHTTNEGQYIPGIIETKKVSSMVAGTAEIWRNSYLLPKLTANREFAELVITLPLPPSPAPFSQAHEEVILQSLSSSLTSKYDMSVPLSGADRRSFLVISIPVEHADAPERPSEFVRGKYASVEAVWDHKTPGDDQAAQDIEWFMAVQSDAGGQIPLLFQEMSMASNIAKDVPLFFDWAHSKKAGTSKE